MSPERWRRVEEAYNAVLQRAPDRRVAALAEICGADEELRREVESLLQYNDAPEAFVDRPAWQAAPDLLNTRTSDPLSNLAGGGLSHYQILEKLGEGGMGVVYKARDTRLGRLVAIKTLPRDKVEDPDRKRRFVQEAKAASALNHPNIVTVYDIEEAGGVEFIAMEYVPGRTLGEMIGRKRLPVSLALDYAVQMAGALAAAHAAGIVHRDLKPANIMVTGPLSGRPGLVKLLDFGMAKLTQPLEPGASVSSVPVQTEEGAIVGTAAYMSPEQAEGKPADTRSDIFSFGAVLYEMVTGRRAFQGDTRLSTLAAILREEPKRVREIAEDVPELLERLILRCLRKDPARRFQHMDDIKVELEALKEDSDSSKLSIAAVAARRWRSKAWMPAAGAVAAVVLAAGGWYYLRPKPTSGRRPALTRITWDSGLTTDPVLSPDGARVAYASDSGTGGNLDIWIQQVATGDRLRLTHNEADKSEPAFSPDGNRIAYRSDEDGGGIYVVSTLGGESRRIARGGRRPRFSPNGELVAYWAGAWERHERMEGGLFVIPSAGGQPKRIRADFKRASSPEWMPDGRHILFAADQGGATPVEDLWVTNIDEDGAPAIRTGVSAVLTKQRLRFFNIGYPCHCVQQLISGPWIPRASGSGYVLLSAASGDVTNVWRVPISGRTYQASGPAEQLTFGTAPETSPQIVPGPGGGMRMVFGTLRMNDDIWSLPLDANRASVKGAPQKITDQESSEMVPSISEDGRKAIYVSDQGGSLNIWARDVVSGKETLVTPTRAYVACMSRDGRRVVYRKEPGVGPLAFPLYMATEGRDPVLVCDDCGVPTAVTRNGEMLIDETFPPEQSLRVVTTSNRKAVPILKHPTWVVSTGRLSPDERWIAFHTTPRVDARQVYVAPFRGPVPIEDKEWIPVTDGQGMERYADWSPDGNTLYFLSERDGFRCIRAQRLEPTSKRPVGPPLDIYHFHHARLSLMNIIDPVYEGFHIAADKAVFAIQERTGNVWMTELPAEFR